MKYLTDWISEKIDDGNINYFDYNEFRTDEKIDNPETSSLTANWKHRRIDVTLKLLRNSKIIESDLKEFVTKVYYYYI
jgi:hypothetical protein